MADAVQLAACSRAVIPSCLCSDGLCLVLVVNPVEPPIQSEILCPPCGYGRRGVAGDIISTRLSAMSMFRKPQEDGCTAPASGFMTQYLRPRLTSCPPSRMQASSDHTSYWGERPLGLQLQPGFLWRTNIPWTNKHLVEIESTL